MTTFRVGTNRYQGESHDVQRRLSEFLGVRNDTSKVSSELRKTPVWVELKDGRSGLLHGLVNYGFHGVYGYLGGQGYNYDRFNLSELV